MSRDLPDHATPRPWSVLDDGQTIYRRAVGAAYIGETREPADAALIVRAVNEYEALLNCEKALRKIRDAGWAAPDDLSEIAADALARLASVRSGADE